MQVQLIEHINENEDPIKIEKDSDNKTIVAQTFVLGFPSKQSIMTKGIYDNPEQFSPERFNPKEINARHNYVCLPFKVRPRECFGKCL